MRIFSSVSGTNLASAIAARASRSAQDRSTAIASESGNNLASSIAARASRFMCGLSISNFLSGLEINFVSSIAPGTCRAWGG